MDGVLVDGEPLHFRAVNELLATEGRELSLDAYKPFMGTQAGWAEFVGHFGLRHPASRYRPLYDALILRHYREQSVALPGARELVTGLGRAGIPLGLASSSKRPWVEACLQAIGLDGAFASLTTGSEIENGKPAPDIYLLAASRLGAEPRECLAIEDAPAGILAAKAAGMTCWAVRTEYTRGIELPRPDREFDSLLQVDLGELVGVAA
jgi:HAD superfamily hydrolase (TIGR01509 family)